MNETFWVAVVMSFGTIIAAYVSSRLIARGKADETTVHAQGERLKVCEQRLAACEERERLWHTERIDLYRRILGASKATPS